ncbi:MAG TPA: hypothetical protein PLU79_01250 [Burkholderiaceae bacterium]|nr:hypothetical protein [Burkholderiaceae bacterium]
MKIQRKTLVLGSISALALAALLAWAFAPRPLEVEVAAVTQGPFETTVDEDGQTRVLTRRLDCAKRYRPRGTPHARHFNCLRIKAKGR